MKKSGFFRLTAALLVGILLLSATACGGSGTPESSAPTAAPTEPTEPEPILFLNPLTGVNDMQTENNRPIGFVVTDENASLTQLNPESADLYFEAETEAGIPRMLAVYSSIDRIPDVIGPVRSARPHFVKFAKALDCIYCHIGGSPTGLQTIKDLGVTDLSNEYEVNATLKSSKNVSWNRSAFVKTKVLNTVNKKKYAVTSDFHVPFQFGDTVGSTTANTLVVKLSESYNMAFTYDAVGGVYEKHRNSLSTPIHVTATGGVISAANVIVMYDHRTFDELYVSHSGNKSNRYDFDFKSGEGLLANNGTARTIRWRCQNNNLQYYESGGVTPLAVKPGKTFVCLVSDTLKSRTKME